MRRAAVSLTLLLLTSCSPTPPDPALQPLAAEATYRLLFNGALVGSALFELEIDGGGAYRLDAFTMPAGQMENRQGHEVLESSRGTTAGATVRPTRFEHSVMRDGDLELMSLEFDWPQRQLRLGGREQRVIALLPDTHDRLSYLLAAARLAAAGEGRLQIQVAALDASEETILEVAGRTTVEVPLGRYAAVSIRRVTPDPAERRELWFAPDVAPLPLRVVHAHDGNEVEMQIEAFSRRPSDPR